MSRTTLVVAEQCGQLGNQLILFAHLIAMAREHGWTVLNPAFCEYAECFEGSRRGVRASYPAGQGGEASLRRRRLSFHLANTRARWLRRWRRPRGWFAPRGFDPEHDVDLTDSGRLDWVQSHRRLYLLGWRYRSYPLLERHQQAVRDYFQPAPGIGRLVASWRDAAGERYERLVGVHIRQGDYADFQGGKYFLKTEQYAMLARTLRDQLPGRVGIAVFSNVSQDLSLFGKDAFAGPGSVAGDLFAMSRCDYLLAVPSTFSRWASFLGRVPLKTVDRHAVSVEPGEFRPASH